MVCLWQAAGSINMDSASLRIKSIVNLFTYYWQLGRHAVRIFHRVTGEGFTIVAPSINRPLRSSKQIFHPLILFGNLCTIKSIEFNSASKPVLEMIDFW
jgi:hypothetical protein